MGGDAGRLKKEELFALLSEWKAGDGQLKPTDGKKDKLLPLFHECVSKMGCWESVVKVLWDPPAGELDAQGRKLQQQLAPVVVVTPVVVASAIAEPQ